MIKRNVFLLIILLVASLFTFFLVGEISKTDFTIYNYLNLERYFFPSEKAKIFHVSSNEGFPVFVKEIIVDPFEVKKGEKQTYSIWAKDLNGIKEVSAIIKADKEETIELRLLKGTKQEGRWVGFWIVKDILLEDSYQTTLRAININNEDTIVTIPWNVLD